MSEDDEAHPSGPRAAMKGDKDAGQLSAPIDIRPPNSCHERSFMLLRKDGRFQMPRLLRFF